MVSPHKYIITNPCGCVCVYVYVYAWIDQSIPDPLKRGKYYSGALSVVLVPYEMFIRTGPYVNNEQWVQFSFESKKMFWPESRCLIPFFKCRFSSFGFIMQQVMIHNDVQGSKEDQGRLLQVDVFCWARVFHILLVELLESSPAQGKKVGPVMKQLI